MERFLSSVPHLKYLELETSAQPDVADGHFWQRIAASLLTLNFKFNVLIVHVGQALDSFRTLFWLEEKRWFVGYVNVSLFSVPYFTPTHMDSLNLRHFRSTAPDHSFLCKHLNQLTMNRSPINENQRLTHVKTLIVDYSKVPHRLGSMIDLDQVRHLIVSTFNQLSSLVSLEHLMPRLNQLTVKNIVTIDMIERVRCTRFTQIHTLNIRTANEHVDCIVQELFRLFPRLECLTYKSTIKSVQMMISLINGFPYLSTASFCADSSFRRKESQFCRDPQSIIENLREEMQNNTICRVYHSTNTKLPFSIHWIIDKKVYIHHNTISYYIKLFSFI